MPEQEIRMVALPKSLHDKVCKEAARQRITPREFVAESVRSWFEEIEGAFTKQSPLDEEEQETLY